MKKLTLEEIQDLIKFVAKSGATEVELEFDGMKIAIKAPGKKGKGQEEMVVMSAPPIPMATAPVMMPTPTIPAPSAPAKESSSDDAKYITIKSSMIGTFYRSASPEKPPFVNVGDTIKVGDTLCIIEAMKLFNEIESDVAGTVVKVLVDDKTPIEFDQPLFLINPS